MKINVLAQEIYEVNRDNGFWDHNNLAVDDDTHWRNFIGTKLALIHSEVSEALEDLRVTNSELHILDIDKETGKPNGFASELADVIIRVLDLSEALGIDMEYVLKKKLDYNRTRSYKHGKNF